jgi:hypothetical protein
MTDRISEIRASLANVAYSGRYYPGDVEADIAYLLDRVEALEGALREIGDFAACHHSEQSDNYWLHALVVDIPESVRRALTTEAP